MTKFWYCFGETLHCTLLVENEKNLDFQKDNDVFIRTFLNNNSNKEDSFYGRFQYGISIKES